MAAARNEFRCCYYCSRHTPERRNPYCHIDCPDYLRECEAHEKRKAKQDMENLVEHNLYSMKDERVRRAIKDKLPCRKME